MRSAAAARDNHATGDRPTGRVDDEEGVRLSLARWLFTPLAGVLAGDWARLLARRGWTISPRYWPRTVFTTCMSVVNSVVSVHERARYGARIAGAEIRAPVFILGHHRSGTTHLWNLLRTNERFISPTVLQAVFPHTMLSFEPVVRGLAERLTPRQRPQDSVEFGPDAPIEEERAICTACFLSMQMARHFPRASERFKRHLTMRDASETERARWKASLDRFGRALLVRHGLDRTLLYKAADHTGKIDLILDLYPDARFVHIHRNPYDVFISTRRMEQDTLPLYAYQRYDERFMDEFVLWRYRAMYDSFLESRARVPAGRLVEVAFAELRASPVEQIERIYAQLGIDGFEGVRPKLESYIESIAGYRMNRHPEIPGALRQRIAERWGRCFDAWGYER